MKETYKDVEDTLYVRCIAKVEILAAVDDSRKVFDIIYSISPCTPIAEFMEYHKDEIKERMRKSQLMTGQDQHILMFCRVYCNTIIYNIIEYTQYNTSVFILEMLKLNPSSIWRHSN